MNILRLVIVVMILSMIYAGAYYYSVQRVEITNVVFTDIQNVTTGGFTVAGSLEIINRGIVPITVESISYDVLLEGSGEILSRGSIQGSTIPPGRSVTLPVAGRITWVPAAELLLEIITPGASYAIINGNVNIRESVVAASLPFQARINIESYLRQFVRDRIERIIDRL
jgi:LEA14-like dessication related protein